MKNNEFTPQEIEFSQLAALYSLDIADEKEQNQVEDYLANFPELTIELAEFREIATAISYSAESAPLSVNLKDRLFSKITENSLSAESELTKILSFSISELQQRAANLEWQEMPNCDAVMATLQVDEKQRQIAFFVRSDTKTQFPMHWHAEGEEVLVLEGDFVVDGEIYQIGDRVYSSGGTHHQPETINGCLLLCISSMDDEFINPE